VQRTGAQGEHPQFADRQSAFRRSAGLRRRYSLGDQRRSVARADIRPINESAEPGAGLRKVESVGPQELFDALQLAYFLDFADDTDASGTLSGARLRSSVQGRGAEG